MAARQSQAQQVVHLLLRVMERLQEPVAAAPKQTSTTNGRDATSTSTIVDEARTVCRENDAIGAAVYDLLLDVLLCQPSASKSMPPPGLSQAGHERLMAGSSYTHQDWETEMNTPSRRIDFKVAILDMILLTKRWSLFMNGSVLGTARTVA